MTVLCLAAAEESSQAGAAWEKLRLRECSVSWGFVVGTLRVGAGDGDGREGGHRKELRSSPCVSGKRALSVVLKAPEEPRYRHLGKSPTFGHQSLRGPWN